MKQKILTRLFSICFILSSSYLSIGSAGSWDEIQSAFKEIKSVSAEFVQEKHMKILSKPFVSKGVFYYNAPDSLRWEYISPVRSILLMHDGKVKHYIKGDKGFAENAGANLQAMQIVLQEITMWLNGRFDDNPNFSASLEPGQKIVITPKEKSFSAIIQRIEIILSSTPGIIKSVMIYESENSLTKLEFNKVELNKAIKESLFQKIS